MSEFKKFAQYKNNQKRLTYEGIIQNSPYVTQIENISNVIGSKNPRQILWHILNDQIEKPICKMCNVNFAKWHEDKWEYRLFCSGSCASKYSSILYREKCNKLLGVSHHTKLESCKQKKIETCLKKYGTEYTTQNKEIKQKRKETCQKIYGGNAPACSIDVRNKMQDTSIERYGVPIATERTDIRNKISKTCLERYGVENALQHPRFVQKSRETSFQRYKRFSHMQKTFSEYCFNTTSDPQILEQYLSNKSVLTAAKELGINYSSLYQIIAKFNLKVVNKGLGISSPQNELATWFKEQNISFVYSTRKIIKPYELDFYFPDYNMAIEFNGDYWHMNPEFYKATTVQRITKKTAKEIWDHDLTKKNLCEDKNIYLITIWENDWIEYNSIIKDNLIRLFNGMTNE